MTSAHDAKPQASRLLSYSEDRLRYWREAAQDDRLVVIASGDALQIAFLGDEPCAHEDEVFLGNGGAVYALYREKGIDLTCNLWSLQDVPSFARHLFTAPTHRGIRLLQGTGLSGLQAAHEIVAAFGRETVGAVG